MYRLQGNQIIMIFNSNFEALWIVWFCGKFRENFGNSYGKETYKYKLQENQSVMIFNSNLSIVTFQF